MRKGRQIRNLKRGRFIRPGRTYQMFPHKIRQPLSHKGLVVLLLRNARTKILGQGMAFAIHQISSKIRPSPANIRFSNMHGTPFALVEKNTAIFIAADEQLFPLPRSPSACKPFRAQMQKLAQSDQISVTDHNAAPAFAAVPAELAIKSIFFRFAENHSLIGLRIGQEKSLK